MAIYKRQGSPWWWYDFTINGQRFRGSTETDDKKEAARLEAKLRNEAFNQEKFARKEALTLSRACGEYWINHAQFLPSAKVTEIYIESLLAFFGKNTQLHKINERDVVSYTSYLRKTGKADSTINRHLNVLIAINNRMRELGYQACEVRLSKRKLSEPEGRTRYLTREEFARLLEELPAYLTYPAIFAVHTGVRKANIVNLTWDQVDMENKIITFKVKSKIKGGKLHVVPMTDTVYDILVEIAQEGKGDYVFMGEGRGGIGDFKKAWKSALERAGIEDFHFHDLRHTSASWIVQTVGRIEMAKEALGHSKIATTMRYAHHQKDALREILNQTFASQIRHNDENGEENDND